MKWVLYCLGVICAALFIHVMILILFDELLPPEEPVNPPMLWNYLHDILLQDDAGQPHL